MLFSKMRLSLHPQVRTQASLPASFDGIKRLPCDTVVYGFYVEFFLRGKFFLLGIGSMLSSSLTLKYSELSVQTL